MTATSGFDPDCLEPARRARCSAVMGLARLQRFGHTPIAIVGGGTAGMIGDPSGKSQERAAAVAVEQIDQNVAGIRAQLARFLDFRRRAQTRRGIVNNADWLASFDLLGFLRDTGKHFTVNYMLQKESVKPPARERGRHFVHRVQLPAAAGATTSSMLLRPLRAARCRWAAATSGATSPPASS